MSIVSLTLTEQKGVAVESCIQSVEFILGDREEAEELRDNWDIFYSMVLDLIENDRAHIGEVKE